MNKNKDEMRPEMMRLGTGGKGSYDLYRACKGQNEVYVKKTGAGLITL